MNTLMQTLKRHTYGIAAMLLLSAMVMPLVFTGSTAAAVLTSRSIEMSTSSPSASSVSYTLRFNPGQAGTVDAIVIDFCEESAVIGAACTTPTGMTVGTTLSVLTNNGSDIASGWTAEMVDSGDALYIHNDSGLTANTTHQVVATVGGFTNPSATGTFYARVFTYADAGDADDYESDDAPEYLDAGGVALSTVDDIDVTAVVTESLTFCVSGTAPDPGCANTTPAALTLGEGDPGAEALETDTISEAIAYFQLSTNAAGVTSIKLRNGAASGGLNSGSNSIPPIDDTEPIELSSGVAGFGVRVPAASSGDDIESADVVGASAYASGSIGYLNMRGTEVTSPYGDEIANTDTGGPVSNANVPLTFGAQASNLTPPGVYTAAIVLIATSTY